MEYTAAWVQTYTCRNIRLEAGSSVTQHLWLPHPMLNTMYDHTQHWQGISNCQDPISKSMIKYRGTNLTSINFLIMGLQTGWRSVK